MPPYAYACAHCGAFLDKASWEANCLVKTGSKPVAQLHAFAMIRKPS